MTLFELVVQARGALGRAGISAATAALDADLLARHARGWDLATWLSRRSESADAAFEQAYAALIARRMTREPVAYIRGMQEFWGRDFLVTPDVLIPRPETELTIEVAVSLLRNRPAAVVADVGTGSGCIAVTLALECPDTRIWATDLSEEALHVAAANAARLNAGDRVRFLKGGYLADIPRPIDIIVSNPPYVADRDARGLSPEVVDHEPAIALFGGPDGLRDVRVLLRQACEALSPDGRLVLEIGYGQSPIVETEVAAVEGLALETIREDLRGIPRVVIAKLAGTAS